MATKRMGPTADAVDAAIIEYLDKRAWMIAYPKVQGLSFYEMPETAKEELRMMMRGILREADEAEEKAAMAKTLGKA
jgi:hypothetical protein